MSAKINPVDLLAPPPQKKLQSNALLSDVKKATFRSLPSAAPPEFRLIDYARPASSKQPSIEESISDRHSLLSIMSVTVKFRTYASIIQKSREAINSGSPLRKNFCCIASRTSRVNRTRMPIVRARALWRTSPPDDLSEVKYSRRTERKT